MKVLFTHNYGKEKFELIKKLGFELIYIPENQLEVDDNIRDIDALVCYNPFKRIDLLELENLKLIQLSSVGIDQLPMTNLRNLNIKVSNNKGGYSIPMGEWIVCKILDIYKNSKIIYEHQNEKRWELVKSVMEISGKKVAFIGTGTIASEAAKRLKGFDLDIAGFSKSGKNKKYFDEVYKISSIHDKISDIDILVIAAPLTGETVHIVDSKVLKEMKDKSVIINVSRGELISEEELIEFLDAGKFLGVALDVFKKEPLDYNSKLWHYDNVHISSHNSWVSEMRNERRFNKIYDNLKRLKKGEELKDIVDLDRGY